MVDQASLYPIVGREANQLAFINQDRIKRHTKAEGGQNEQICYHTLLNATSLSQG